jgi:type II secretory pathway pseudopilin PulG
LKGFSLVEVSIAIGIAAFCLVVIIGLLPAGLKVVKTSREEIAAANCLKQIADAIHAASPLANAAGTYQALGAYSNLTWSLAGPPVTATFPGLSFSGFPTTNSPDQRLAAYVKVYPPADSTSAGQAMISVGWPASMTWNESQTNWTQAQGALYTRVIFLPASR